jgi:hypothetical protein
MLQSHEDLPHLKAGLLDDEFKSRGIEYAAGRVLLQPDDAISLVNRAADEGVPIVSVDGFHVNDTRPHDCFADFSPAVREGHGSWEEAERFILAWREPGLLFEVVLGSDPIEAV